MLKVWENGVHNTEADRTRECAAVCVLKIVRGRCTLYCCHVMSARVLIITQHYLTTYHQPVQLAASREQPIETETRIQRNVYDTAGVWLLISLRIYLSLSSVCLYYKDEDRAAHFALFAGNRAGSKSGGNLGTGQFRTIELVQYRLGQRCSSSSSSSVTMRWRWSFSPKPFTQAKNEMVARQLSQSNVSALVDPSHNPICSWLPSLRVFESSWTIWFSSPCP